MIFTSKWKPGRESRQRLRIFVVLVSIIDLTQSCNRLVTIHSGDDVSESVSIPSLSPNFGSIAWLLGWIVELIGSFTKKQPDISQWYIVVDATKEIHSLSTLSGVSLVRTIGLGAHIITGPSSTPLHLSSIPGVIWVGRRPDRHKLDPALRFLVGGKTSMGNRSAVPNFTHSSNTIDRAKWRRVSFAEEFPQSRMGFIRSLVVVLTQDVDGPQAAARIARRWTRRFARRGWDADAMAVSGEKVVVHLDYSRGGGAGSTGSLLAQVAVWLTGRPEVLWVEPRAANEPAARYVSRLLTFGRGTAADLTGAILPPSPAAGGGLEEIYNPSASARAAVEAALTFPSYTGSWTVNSESGPGLPGSFCAFLPRAAPGSAGGGMVRGPAGVTGGFLNNVASGTVTVVDRSKATVTLSPDAGGALSPDDGAYDGMAAAFCAAVADCSTTGAANFSIVRYLAGPPATAVVDPVWPAAGAEGRSPGAKQHFLIRPVLQPGDTLTVHAYAAAWSAAYAPDALIGPAAAIGKAAAGTFTLPRCSASGAGPTPALAGLPALLWGLGYRRLRYTCQPSAAVAAALTLPVPAGVSAGGCADYCAGALVSPAAAANLSVLWARAGLCGPVNISAGQAAGWQAGQCTCTLQQARARPTRPPRTRAVRAAGGPAQTNRPAALRAPASSPRPVCRTPACSIACRRARTGRPAPAASYAARGGRPLRPRPRGPRLRTRYPAIAGPRDSAPAAAARYAGRCKREPGRGDGRPLLRRPPPGPCAHAPARSALETPAAAHHARGCGRAGSGPGSEARRGGAGRCERG